MNTNNSYDDIERANLEINRLRNELRETLAEAAKAREETRLTLHNLARDFRVSLASVLGFTDLLSASYSSHPREFNEIAIAGHQLMDLVKSMEAASTAEMPVSTAEMPVKADPEEGSDDDETSASDVRVVLHIEDNETNFRLVERILQDRANLELLWAANGEVGLTMACKRPPSLILLDLNLPDIHGSDVLIRLKNNPLTRDVPIIVLSADVTPSQIERMLQAGARDYMTKPFDIKRFLCLVDECLAPAEAAA